MSVILDALHKARGDKRNPQPEPQPNSVARVLEAGVAPDGAGDFIGERPSPRGRGWIAGIAIVFAMVCLLALIGGGFFLLYDQVRRLEAKAIATPAASSALSPTETALVTESTFTELPPVPALPTPLPLSDLPVQPPAAAASPYSTVAAAPENATAAPAVVADPRPDFKLGSIVCEEGICVASLNGRSVRVGDEVRSYRVIQISESAIMLKSTTGNDTITLSQYD